MEDQAPPNSTREVLDGARERLRELRRQLADFLAGSEAAFLHAGARLVDVDGRARGLLGISAGAVAPAAGAGTGDPAQQLEDGLGRMERYLRSTRDAAEADLGHLARVDACVESIVQARSAFDDIARTLRVLGMTTRIENARADARNAGMETVAAEVPRHAGLVGATYRDDVRQTVDVGATAAGARATAAGFVQRDGEHSARMVDEARSALAALRALAASEAAVASRAAAGARGVAEHVAAVIVSLQGHDATRQALEHVVEELDAFERDVSAADVRTPEDATPWLAEAAAVCRLLAAQVRGARERVVDALARVAESLRSIAALVTELHDDAERLTGGEAGAPGERVRRGVAQVTQALGAHLAHERETADAMGRVSRTVHGIETRVHELRAMGYAVKIIALNALVQTERSGEGGRVLAVLARGMGVLAGDVARCTGEVARSLREIASVADDLGRRGSGAEEGRTITADLEVLVAHLARAHGELHAAVGSLRDGGRELSGEVGEIARGLEEQAGIARSLQRLETGLDDVGSEATAHAGAGTARPPARRVTASSRYTMDAEREIHGAVHGAVSERGTGHAEAVGGGAAASGFGGNVELF